LVYQGRRADPELIEELTEEILANLENKLERARYQRRYPRRHTATLRRELYGELRAMQRIQKRLAQTKNPEVRAALDEILNETRNMGIGLDELLGALPGTYSAGIKERLTNLLPQGGSLMLLLALLALLAIPSVREKVRPSISKVMEQAMGLAESARTLAAQLRESFEDIVAEAQFDRLKKTMEDTGATEPTITEPQTDK